MSRGHQHRASRTRFEDALRFESTQVCGRLDGAIAGR
jgi:hypothetical protein